MADLALAEPIAELAPEITRRVPVPWHCQRRAEQLIEHVITMDRGTGQQIRALVDPIIARAKRGKVHAPIRKTDILDLARAWAGLPSAARLGLVIDRDPNGRGILISDCRVTASEFTLADWPTSLSERGLVIVLIRLTVRPHNTGMNVERLAYISRHALGRYFERAYAPDDEDVLADCQRLVIEHDRLLRCDPFALRTPNGIWVGEPQAVFDRPERTLGVRSFLTT